MKIATQGRIPLILNNSSLPDKICRSFFTSYFQVFASMLAATIHCRHLMAWNIFAPKLIFESIGIMITLGSVLVGYLILVRINKKVEDLIITLNKIN